MNVFDVYVRHRHLDDDVFVKPADRNIRLQDECALRSEPVFQIVTVQFATLNVILERFAADVFVDNVRIGTVGEFTSTTQPLGLSAGRHHIEIRASGYRSITDDVDITPGEVIPYSGTLER